MTTLQTAATPRFACCSAALLTDFIANGTFACAQWSIKLGAGSHKTVYKGWDSLDGKEVAWNEVLCSQLPPDELERLQNEVSILKSIRHPNLIGIEATWATQEAVIFITPFVPSGDLRRWMLARFSHLLGYIHLGVPCIGHSRCSSLCIFDASGVVCCVAA